jgi:putative transposase
MVETCIRVEGEWVYLHRAVDQFGKTLDFMLSKWRNKPDATKFYGRALKVSRLPCKIVTDRSGSNTAAIYAVRRRQKSYG